MRLRCSKADPNPHPNRSPLTAHHSPFSLTTEPLATPAAIATTALTPAALAAAAFTTAALTAAAITAAAIAVAPLAVASFAAAPLTAAALAAAPPPSSSASTASNSSHIARGTCQRGWYRRRCTMRS